MYQKKKKHVSLETGSVLSVQEGSEVLQRGVMLAQEKWRGGCTVLFSREVTHCFQAKLSHSPTGLRGGSGAEERRQGSVGGDGFQRESAAGRAEGGRQHPARAH